MSRLSGSKTEALTTSRRSSSTGPGLRPRPVVRVLALVALAIVLVTTGCSGGGDDRDEQGTGPPSGVATSDEPLRVTTLSGPPLYVTGGDAVVAVDSPARRSLDDVRITIDDGTDITERFVPDPRPHGPSDAPPRLIATLTDLPPGESTVRATSGDATAELTLVDHDPTGPLFSGPHQSPFVCTTERAGLGAPLDDCGAATTVSWQYWNSDGQLLDLPRPGELPPDAATTSTSEGAEVPFVVRLERSVLNRSITTIAVLDPSAGGSTGDGWNPSGWNGRLVLRFGGGCGTRYSQGTPSPNALDRDLLAAGYAVASGSLTSFETACNATVAAETAMVVKEHFVETYGIPRHTIGEGGSGGAIQLLQIAQNYPGILDALGLAAPFP
ncbi:MAG TPA: DUF6351 family protein, partial [Acidimicrobiales bacterium]